MKKRILLIFALALFSAVTLQTFYVHAHVGTQNSLTRNYVAPNGVSMFTDVYIRSERIQFMVSDNDDRNIISRIGNGRVREWESDIDFIMRAPELEMRIQSSVAAGTEFGLRLHNLTWFFRSIEDHTPSIFIDADYSGGIERLLPTNYSRFRGLFVPSGTGTGGVYTRIVSIHSNEVPFELRISDDNNREATVVLLEGANYGDIIRIPLITKAPNSMRSASVEVIGTDDRLISSGLYPLLSANTIITDAMRRNATHTSATMHMTGTDHIRIPEIIIRENTHGIIESGSIKLTAPEGFIFVPDVEQEKLGRIGIRSLNRLDENGLPIINISLGGGLSWRNLMVLDDTNPQRSAIAANVRIRYNHPIGGLDPSVLIIEFSNISRSQFRDLGYLTISGLRLVAVEDVEPGIKYVEISAFTNMKNLTEQSFRVGTILPS